MNELGQGWRIIGSNGNVIGLCRAICLKCKKCKGNELKWRIVKRVGKSGKQLYGLECDEVKIRVFNGNFRKRSNDNW